MAPIPRALGWILLLVRTLVAGPGRRQCLHIWLVPHLADALFGLLLVRGEAGKAFG